MQTGIAVVIFIFFHQDECAIGNIGRTEQQWQRVGFGCAETCQVGRSDFWRQEFLQSRLFDRGEQLRSPAVRKLLRHRVRKPKQREFGGGSR